MEQFETNWGENGISEKRGRVYYIRYHVSENGETKSLMKSLRTRQKDVAQKMVRDLEKLEDLG